MLTNYLQVIKTIVDSFSSEVFQTKLENRTHHRFQRCKNLRQGRHRPETTIERTLTHRQEATITQ